MSDTTITAEEMAEIRRIAVSTGALPGKASIYKKLAQLLDAIEQAEAENSRMKLKCGEAAPEGTEIFPCVGSSEYVLCPTCGYEIEDPWDEPGVEINSEGCDGTLECRNCSAIIEVHHRIIDFWTARLADAEAARRAVADSEVKG